MNNKIINAGGGVVRNNEGEILMIYRNDRWDLPKGKLEPNESIEQCALREVCEECGLDSSQLTLDSFITETIHHYVLNDTTIEKHTSWYRMSYTGSTTPTPQTEEGIIKAEWVSLDVIPTLLRNSYPTIESVFDHL